MKKPVWGILLWLSILPVLAAPVGSERQLVQEIATADQRLDTLSHQQTELLKKSDALIAQKKAHEDDRQQALLRLSDHRADASQRLKTLYRMRRRGVAMVLLSADTPADFRRRFTFLTQIVQSDRDKTLAYMEAVDNLQATDDQLNSDLAAIAETRRNLDKNRADLESRQKERVALLNEIRGNPELNATWVQQADTARASYSPPPPPPETPSSLRTRKGNLPSPIHGKVSRGFGPYKDSDGESHQNLGVDFKVPVGTPFVAIADGEVSQVKYVPAYGMTILVTHGPYMTLYAHASAARAAQGQVIKAGDLLGMAGNTGLTDDSNGYLHFEIRYNGTPQDPQDWLAAGALQCLPDATNCP